MAGNGAGIRRWTWLGFAAGLLVICGVLALAYRRAGLVTELPALLVERHQLRTAVAMVTAAAAEAEATARSFLLSGDTTDLGRFERARAQLDSARAQLRRIPQFVGHDQGLATVDSLIHVRVGLLQHTIAVRRDSGLAAAVLASRPTPSTPAELRRALDTLEGKSVERLASHEVALLAQLQTSERLIGAGSGLALLLLLMAAYLVHRGTEQLHQVAQQLRLSEERLRLITANVHEMVVAFDLDQQLLFVNPAFETLTGDPISALEHRSLASYCHPVDEPTMRPLWQQVRAGEQVTGQEFRIVRSDGIVRWCTSSWGPVRDAQGQQLGVVGTVLDITVAKEAEEQLRSDAQLLAAIAESQQAIATTAPDLQAVMTSIADHAVALTGGDGAGVAMLEGEELAYRVASGSVTRHIGMRLGLQGSLAGLAVRTGEILHSDNTETDPRVDQGATRQTGVASMLVVPLIYDGRPVGVISVVAHHAGAFTAGHVRSMRLLAGLMAAAMSHATAFRDASLQLKHRTAALLESEDRFRHIVETAQEGIWLLDEKGITRYGNRRLAELLGCPAAQLPGRPVLEFLPTPDRQAALKHFQPGATAGSRGDLQLRRADGEVFWAMVSVAPVRTAEGAAVGTLAMVTDVTARHEADEALRRQAERLRLLHELDQRILTAGSVPSLAETALTQVRRLVPCDRANLVLFDLGRGIATVVAEHGSILLPTRRNRPIPLSDFSPADVLPQGPTRIIADLARVAHPTPVLQELLAAGVRSVLTVPLVGARELLGEVNLAASRPDAFTPEHQAIAHEVAAQIAIALQQSHLRQRLESRAARLQRRVHDQAARLDDLNGELAAWAQAATDHLTAPPEARDRRQLQRIEGLRRLARASTAQLQRQATPMEPLVREIAATFSASPGDHTEWRIEALPVLDCDPGLIRLALTELLDNAVKFSRSRQPAVIAVTAIAREDTLGLTIRDNGVGFDMGQTATLFSLFGRLHSPSEREGVGLGLAVARRAIHRHGGRLWAEAEPGRGAAFSFVIGAESRPEREVPR